jgi:acyl-CoA thioesterase FadM
VSGIGRQFSFRAALPMKGGFAVYARLLEQSATLASADAGYPPDWYAAHATAWVIRRSTIDCAAAIPRGVELEVTTWVADFRRVRSRREYEVRIPDGPVAVLTAHTDWVYVDAASGSPRRAVARSWISSAVRCTWVPARTSATTRRWGSPKPLRGPSRVCYRRAEVAR